METDALLTLVKDVTSDVITPRFRSLSGDQIMEKNPGDLVTVADREAEVLLTRALLADDPSVLVVGEEATAADPTLLERLAGAPHAFLVDPVDGTKNFVHGRPDYAVMVAELRDGVCVRGVIWQPEYERMYVAEQGRGLTVNGEPVTRSAPGDDPRDWKVLISRPDHEGRHGDITVSPTAWCCGVDYPWLATGEADALVYTRTMPWDHAAGSLFVAETGGVVRYLDGTDYVPGTSHPGHLVAAASPQVWDGVTAALADVLGRP